MNTKKNTLGKKERLKSRKSIEQLFSEGNRFGVQPFKVFYLISKPGEPAVKFGVGVSAKNFRKAVDRNRVKRLTREVYRVQKSGLKDAVELQKIQLDVFIIYIARELPVFQDVQEKMKLIINKLISLVNEKAATHT